MKLGLHRTGLTEAEFFLAETLTSKYIKLSIFDCIALAIAKNRGITLLTGDGTLRKAAAAEGVNVLGMIGILDKLHNEKFITDEEYTECLEHLICINGGKVRLPMHELEISLHQK